MANCNAGVISDKLNTIHLDEDLLVVKKAFSALDDDDVTKKDDKLHEDIKNIIRAIKEKDNLFNKTLNKIVCGNTFFRGTEIENAQNFDLYLVIDLPLNSNAFVFEVYQYDSDGFVRIRIPKSTHKLSPPLWKNHSDQLSKSIKGERFLNQKNFRAWFSKALDQGIAKFRGNCQTYQVCVENSDTAFRLSIKKPNYPEIKIGFIPCLSLKGELKFYRRPSTLNISATRTWMAVPSGSCAIKNLSLEDILWKFSFVEQEREYLANAAMIKPVIRRIKDIRDSQDLVHITDYCIYNLCMCTIDKWHNGFLKTHFSNGGDCLFHLVFDILKNSLQRHKIPYFWNSNVNLLKGVDKDVIKQYVLKIRKQEQKNQST